LADKHGTSLNHKAIESFARRKAGNLPGVKRQQHKGLNNQAENRTSRHDESGS
jgi:hypothetical protein